MDSYLNVSLHGGHAFPPYKLWAMRLVAPVGSGKDAVTAILLLEVPSLLWSLFLIEVVARGLGEAQPWADLPMILLRVGVTAIIEEFLFRGAPRLVFGEVGQYVGTGFWVIAHQFTRVGFYPLRLPSDSLSGLLFVRLWRGRFWPVAIVVHAIGNVLFVIALQGLNSL